MTVAEIVAARRRGRQRLAAQRFVIGAVVALGVLPVALELARPAGLFGLTEYDDGVYFAASLRLISGIFPYKDFVFVQPPGITVVLAPFAALSHLVGARHALGLARILTAIVAGSNAGLVSYILRRKGVIAMALGGVAMALFPTGYTAVHTFLLEPFCVLFCLIAVAVIFDGDGVASRRRCAVAGACLGFAGAIKVFAIVPILILCVIVVCVRRRAILDFVGGIVGSVAVFVLPFFVAAPSGFVHDVIASQLGRSTGSPTSLVNRLFAVTGLAYSSPSLEKVSAKGQPVPAAAINGTATWLAASLLAVTVVVLAIRLVNRSERTPLEWFIVAGAIGSSVIALVPAAYYDHYAYFSAPFLALALGAAACLAVRLVRAGTEQLAGTAARTVRRAMAGTFVVLLCGGTAFASASATSSVRAIMDNFGDPGTAVAATVPPGKCTISDSASLLVSAGRADAGPPGCPAIVDATGTWLAIDPLHPPVRSGIEYSGRPAYKDPKLVAIWSGVLKRADYVVLSGACAWRIPWTPALASYFDTHFTKVHGPYGLAFRRGTPTTTADRPVVRDSCAATVAK